MGGRDQSERLVAINRNWWSQSAGTRMLGVHRGLKDIFDLHIPASKLYRFKAIMAAYYSDLSKEILTTILSASVVHIDETPVKLRKTLAYVWVVSSLAIARFATFSGIRGKARSCRICSAHTKEFSFPTSLLPTTPSNVVSRSASYTSCGI
jgi:hypothetical protein